jgi:hypothetical protein
MLDFAYNDGSCGFAFEPLRDDTAAVALRPPALAGAPAPVAARTFVPQQAQALAAAAPRAAAPSLGRSHRRAVSATTLMPVAPAKRVNQLVQHIAASYSAVAADSTRGLPRELRMAAGAPPKELGGELPREWYVEA